MIQTTLKNLKKFSVSRKMWPQKVFTLKVFILINKQPLRTANANDINTDYYLTNCTLASRYHGSLVASRYHGFLVALSVIFLLVYAKCNYASKYAWLKFYSVKGSFWNLCAILRIKNLKIQEISARYCLKCFSIFFPFIVIFLQKRFSN